MDATTQIYLSFTHKIWFKDEVTNFRWPLLISMDKALGHNLPRSKHALTQWVSVCP